MSKKFKDPTEVKSKVNGVEPWGFAAPSKDQGTSGYIGAGNYYGVGHRQPVGKESASGIDQGPIPQKAMSWEYDVSENRRG